MLVFISGGVRSGKSTFAEKLAYEAFNPKEDQLNYIATCQVYDDEMESRVRRHQVDRENSGFEWVTWEQNRNLSELVDSFSKYDVVLLDCLTTLTSNELFYQDRWKNHSLQYELFDNLIETFTHLKNRVKALIIVSNEVFQNGLPTDNGTSLYLHFLGKLHQSFVSMADQAYLVEFGMPLKMKGDSQC